MGRDLPVQHLFNQGAILSFTEAFRPCWYNNSSDERIRICSWSKTPGERIIATHGTGIIAWYGPGEIALLNSVTGIDEASTIFFRSRSAWVIPVLLAMRS